MTQKRIGVIGWLSEFNNEYARTVAACDTNEARLAAWAKDHPDGLACRDYKEMLAAKLEAVFIATPNWLHAEMAIFFMRHGVHVFLEKPMGVNKAEIDAVLAAQQQAGVMCAIDFEWRASAGRQRVREIIRDGEIGELHGLELIHHRGGWVAEANGVWRTNPAQSGGLFFMEICHGLDMFRCVLGDITQVQSFSHPNVLPQYRDMPDNVVSHFWFANGKRGVIVSSHTSSVFNPPSFEKYHELGHDMAVIYLGTQGAIRMDCIRQQLLVVHYAEYHPDAPVGTRVEFRRREDFSHLGMNFFHDIGANQLCFLQALARGEPHHQDTLDAWKTHVVCLAAERSALTPGFPRIEIDYSPHLTIKS
jgi:predicted dehydrogenase